MKIVHEPKQFSPITITLETIEDLRDFHRLLDFASAHARSYGPAHHQATDLLEKIFLINNDIREGR